MRIMLYRAMLVDAITAFFTAYSSGSTNRLDAAEDTLMSFGICISADNTRKLEVLYQLRESITSSYVPEEMDTQPKWQKNSLQYSNPDAYRLDIDTWRRFSALDARRGYKLDWRYGPGSGRRPWTWADVNAPRKRRLPKAVTLRTHRN